LVSVTDFPGLVVPTSWSAKVKLVGERVAFGPETIPMPLKARVCGLPAALSETLNPALRNPDLEGLNVTLIVQLAPAANEVPQVWVWEKFPALVPVIAMPVMLKLVVPMLVSVTVFAGLVVPTT
jgi:hypothetical protein